MPLSALQVKLLRLLADHRNPQSAVAGATPLSRAGRRVSGDIDIFHDRDKAVSAAATLDAQAIEAAGYALQWVRKDSGIWTAVVRDDTSETKLEWVHDSDYRFFPALPDAEFGFVLHPVDIATNKALAAAGRREPRDAVDLIQIHDAILPLGAVVWAAVAKDPGWSPESLIAQIRRNGRYRDDDLKILEMHPALSAAELSQRLRAALDEAEAFVLRMPSEKAGLIFLQDDRAVQPDPLRLDLYQIHDGSRGGHWPSSSEVTSAMLAAWSEKAVP
jgi:hypothetical protein